MSDPRWFGISDRQMVESIVSDMFFCDVAIVESVYDSKIDATLASLAVDLSDNSLDKQSITGIEVLFPSSSGMSQSWTLAQGDVVILFGMRSLVPSTANVTESKRPPEFWHYSPQTVKAVPLWGKLPGKVQFGEQNGKAFLRTATASLHTFLKTMNDALQTFMGPSSQASISDGGSSPASLASAIVALMVSFVSSTATLAADLENLLEA